MFEARFAACRRVNNKCKKDTADMCVVGRVEDEDTTVLERRRGDNGKKLLAFVRKEQWMS